jgi:hypothetical protein
MENWFDYFKDRRYVPIFFVTLLALFVGPLILGIFFKIAADNDLLNYWPLAAIATGLWLLVLTRCAIADTRARRRGRNKISPLSRDERTKARSKLQSGMNSLKRPAPRAPDTDLKY